MDPQIEWRVNGEDWHPVEFDPNSSVHALLRLYHTLILIDNHYIIEYRNERIDL